MSQSFKIKVMRDSNDYFYALSLSFLKSEGGKSAIDEYDKESVFRDGASIHSCDVAEYLIKTFGRKKYKRFKVTFEELP